MIRRVVLLLLPLFASAAVPEVARAVAISPRALEAARGTPEEAALRERMQRYTESRSRGVDRVYSQFALNLAKYPRGGVAHRNILVVLCDFAAEGSMPGRHPSGVSTSAYYHRLFFSDDPNDGLISLREYYRANSNGRLIISGRVTPRWLPMPHAYAYYANGFSGLDFASYPRSAQRLAEDAMAAAYREFDRDLSYFDNDGPDGIPHSGDDDGYIDAVCVVHPGVGAELSVSDDDLWSHESGIAIYQDCPPGGSQSDCQPGMTLGSVRGFLYFMVAEYNDYPGDQSAGTYFHEFGHTLGLPDLYGVTSNALGIFSLMAFGNYVPIDSSLPLGSRPSNLDAWCRQFLGFEIPTVPTGPGTYTLPPVSRGGGSLKLWRDGLPGTEYFLVENRKQEGSDAQLPGSGLLIYHVDDTKIDNLGGTASYRVRLMQADGLGQLDVNQVCTGIYCGEAGDFYPGSTLNRSFTEATTPSSRDYAGGSTGVRVTGIVAGAGDGVDDGTLSVIVSDNPAIRVAGLTIRDGGDDYADPGETDSLDVTLHNVGTASAALSLTLTTADPGITITGGSSSAPGIPAGGVAAATTPFVFDVGAYATLPHVARFALAWSDGSASGVESLSVAVGMGLGLTADFEAGVGPWSSATVRPAGPNDWHLTQSRAHGGAWSFKAGSILPLGSGGSNEAQTYADDQDAALYTPFFDLPTGSEIVFHSWIDTETNGGTAAWDGGRVEISTDGQEWFPLDVDGGYGHLIEFNSGANLRGSDAFAGPSSGWRRVVADLSAYGGPVRIRFRFASDVGNSPFSYDLFGSPYQSRYYEGWYIDDVEVRPRVAPGPTPRPLSLRAGPNPYRIGAPSAGSITIRFSARDGLEHAGALPEVRIYDVRGRLVKTLRAAPDALIPSEYRATWNARDEQGSSAPAGIYLAHVTALGREESFRIVILR